jgi:ATP-dependent DNA ligase
MVRILLPPAASLVRTRFPRCRRAAADRAQGAARRVHVGCRAAPALQRLSRGRGPAFHEQARKLELEGIVSKRADAPYSPGNRGLWLKVKCLYRGEFLVVGWTDPEGRRPWLGAPLLAYYDPDGRLVYAGRAGTGIKQAELERLWRRLQPLSIGTMPLDVPPPRTSRFGSPLVLSRVHWVRPELVAEVKFLTWTDDNLLRQVVYEGLCEDKPAAGVRRPVPHSSR